MTELVTGVVIRVTEYKEADRMLTILTDMGDVMSASVKGASKRTSRVAAAAQMFTYATFKCFKRGNMYLVDEADIHQQFVALTQDIDSMALASYFAELVAWQRGGESEPNLIRLLLNMLYALASGGYDRSIVKAVFELKISQIWGYQPALNTSGQGYTGSHTYISRQDGTTADENHSGQGNRVSVGVIQAIAFVLTADIRRVLSFSLGKQDVALFATFCQDFLLHKLDNVPKTLSFYRLLEQTSPIGGEK